MDVNAKIDELIEIVESARAMPMSASCVINRAQVLDLLDDLKRGLPEEMDKARRVLADRESVLADGRREAERLLERTRSERESIIGNTDVSREARGAAERILAEARHEAEQMRQEAEDWVDQKLANFEVVLTKTIQAVGRGREKMRGSSNPMEELGRHVDEQDAVAEERRRSRDFGDENRFDGYESQEFTVDTFAAEAERPYEQHEYEHEGYPERQGDYVTQGAYASDQHDGYSYEQGAYDQGAAHGYGTGEFHTDPQPAHYGGQGYGDQDYANGYGQPQQYGQPPQQRQAPPAQYPSEETSYFDTGLIDVRQFQHDGYGR
ncbi:MAG TPA: ATP synthase F0 subunit B [Actinocrinis sp.]|uniref:ATP synthase F0 subunit B n=1 Tax=Actinocrinis sp. TaxID=1920516 RepID=UPI002DDCEEEF|nr:ATP synthase F0 subunit B [Actinocrinis sp.]HEV2342604.1 ATP synthase F0 subunit B [Actinocrinis sp.]